MNEASKSSANSASNQPECLEDIDDIINFISQHQPFIEASFSPDSGFAQWVDTELTQQNQKLANDLGNFSRLFLEVLQDGGAIDVRKDYEGMELYQDPVACFIDGIMGIEPFAFVAKNNKGELVKQYSLYERNPDVFEKKGNNLLRKFLEESSGEVSECLAYGLPLIEPAIKLWHEFQAKNNSSAENKTPITKNSPLSLKIKKGTVFSPKKKSNNSASSVSSTSSTTSEQKTETSDYPYGYSLYNSDFGLSDCYGLDDNFSEDSVSSSSSTSSTSSAQKTEMPKEEPSIPQLTAASMSTLFIQGQNPNTYQQIAHHEAITPNKKSPEKEKKGKKRFFDEIKVEETENKENDIDDGVEMKTKHQKISGCFSGAPTY